MAEFDYEGMDPFALYQMFCDDSRDLGGFIIAMDKVVTSEAERLYWRDRLISVNDERRGIDPNDRKAQISAMRRWRTELADVTAILNEREANDQASSQAG